MILFSTLKLLRDAARRSMALLFPIAATLFAFSTTSFAQSVPSSHAQRTTTENVVTQTETISFENLPADVQQKINSNKATGKDLFSGIVKIYPAQINACTNKATTRQTLAFLNAVNGLVGYDFISPGLVNIKVVPTFDSVALKDILRAHNVAFDFINEQFAVAE